METSEKRIELHKKLRNLSPIRKNDKNEEIATKLTEKSQNPQVKNKLSKRDKPSQERITSIVSKNINEYRHIINTQKPDDTELKWVLQLRAYKEKGRYRKLGEFKKDMHINVYERDIEEYLDRVKRAKRAELKTAQPNMNEYKHLCQTRLDGTANTSQFRFESTLRNFYTKDSKDKWREVSELQKPRLFSSYYSSKNILSPVNNKIRGPDCVLKAHETVYDVMLLLKFR